MILFSLFHHEMIEKQKFRSEKQALRQTNQELMDRLKKLWKCYKEKSTERPNGNSMSSQSSTTSMNNTKSNNYENKVAKVFSIFN